MGPIICVKGLQLHLGGGGGGGCYCEADRIWFGSDKCMYLNFTTKNTEIEKLVILKVYNYVPNVQLEVGKWKVVH